MDSCTIDCIEIIGNFTQEATCNFVADSCQQDTVQFIQAYYCGLNQSFILLIFFSAVVLFFIYFALNALTNHYLTPCVQEFIDKLRLSQGLAGVTFLAFANGAPDIITAVVAGSSSSSSTALIPFGSLYGAALFDMAFILAMVIQLSPTQSITLIKREALLPLGFYIFGSLYLIAVSAFYGSMNAIISGFFLTLYPAFIICNIYYERKLKVTVRQASILEEGSVATSGPVQEKKTMKEQMQEVEKEIQQEEEAEERKEGAIAKVMRLLRLVLKFAFEYSIPPATKEQWTPRRAIISLAIAPFISMLSFGLDSFQQTFIAVPYAVWLSIPAILLLIHSAYCSVRGKVPQSGVVVILYSIYSFIIVVCWITMICSVLINLLELLQMLTNINPVFLGLTVLAWANCIGDYLSITAFAKKGYASTAIAGIFSGPLLTFLMGFGISCTLNSLNGEYSFDIFNLAGGAYNTISDLIVVSVIVMAIGYMVWIFIRIIRCEGELGKQEQKVGKFYYVGFVVVALLLSILTDFFRTTHCDL